MLRRHVLILSALLIAAGCSGGDGGGGGDNGGITGPADKGTLNGRATGPGGGVPNAQVSLTGGGTQKTDSEGHFTFTGVAPGSKTLTITPPTGFELAGGETAGKSAAVTAGGTASVNWSLRLSDNSPRSIDINLSASSFSPADVTLPVGSTVKWYNETAIAHTISPNSPNQAGTWPEANISGAGSTVSHTFGTAGTFDYVCKLHAGMTGVVRVH